MIQIFLPRVALRRRRLRPDAVAPAPIAGPLRPEARLSPTCECPELRSSARTLRELEPVAAQASSMATVNAAPSEIALDVLPAVLVEGVQPIEVVLS